MKKFTLLFLVLWCSTMTAQLFVSDGTEVLVEANLPFYTNEDFQNEGTLTFSGSADFYVDAGIDNSASSANINFNDATLHIGSGDGDRSASTDNFVFKDRDLSTLTLFGTELAASDYLTLTPGDVVKFVVLNKNGGITNVTGGHLGISETLLLTSGELNGETTVTLLNRSGTDAAQVLTSSGGTARIEVERFISAKRAFRFYAPAVNSSQTLHEQLQEGATAHTDDPVPGFGTHITGVAPGAANAPDTPTLNADQGGLDWQPSGDPSMFVWDEASNPQKWEPVLATNTTTTSTSAYRLMVRGNRSHNVTLNPGSTGYTEPGVTILRSRGELKVGDVVSGTDFPFNDAAEKVNFVANPYAARVDFSQVGISEIAPYIAVWDASINARGGYVSILASTGAQGNDPDPTGSSATNILEPGQSFFVQNTATGGSSITFAESHKATSESATGIFSSGNSFLNLRLETTEEDLVIDGLGFRFNDSFNIEADINDARKFENSDTNFAIVNSGSLLYIDNRPAPSEEVTVPLLLTGHTFQNYVFIPTFELNGLTMDVYLKDNYLNQLTEIENLQPISFDVDESIPASINPFRFELIFNPTPLSNDEFKVDSISMYPNPASSDVTIVLPSTASVNDWNVKIFSINGQLVKQMTHDVNETNLKLDVSNFETGMYLIELTNDVFRSTQKLLKK